MLLKSTFLPLIQLDYDKLIGVFSFPFIFINAFFLAILGKRGLGIPFFVFVTELLSFELFEPLFERCDGFYIFRIWW